MSSVQFNTHIKNGIMEIPPQYKDLNNHEVSVIILKNDDLQQNIKNVSEQEQAFYENLLKNMSADDKAISSVQNVVI
ncbi:MAG: hypothetical protein DRQ51_10500 [Gammaproteobacteria bacterium]|nr:MAG: hypothetical protein DRQ51_10500 [Gammaproteobacteria bacterium]